jgi:hypothetical protein
MDSSVAEGEINMEPIVNFIIVIALGCMILVGDWFYRRYKK